MKENIKSVIIVLFAILLIVIAIFGIRTTRTYQDEIAGLKAENEGLNADIAKRDILIYAEKARANVLQIRVDSLKKAFKAQGLIVGQLIHERDEALAQLTGITSDSVYQYLVQIAYQFPGIKKFLFNDAQIRHIASDYVTARSSEKIIPALNSQIATCKSEMSASDSTNNGLRKVIDLQRLSLIDCQKVNDNNNTIIKDTEEQRDKERGRKEFWRITTAVMGGVAIILAIL